MKSFMFSFFATLICAAIGWIAPAAFAQDSSSWGTAQQPASVVRGVVIQVRDVTIKTQRTNEVVGIIAPALGSILGAALTKNSSNWQIKALAGGAGAAAGSTIAQSMNFENGQEIVVQLDGGTIIAVAQSAKDGVRFAAKQAVLVLGGGRIVPLGVS